MNGCGLAATPSPALFDARLATLRHHGVDEFATRNINGFYRPDNVGWLTTPDPIRMAMGPHVAVRWGGYPASHIAQRGQPPSPSAT